VAGEVLSFFFSFQRWESPRAVAVAFFKSCQNDAMLDVLDGNGSHKFDCVFVLTTIHIVSALFTGVVSR
jgi:hypothetical protein